MCPPFQMFCSIQGWGHHTLDFSLMGEFITDSIFSLYWLLRFFFLWFNLVKLDVTKNVYLLVSFLFLIWFTWLSLLFHNVAKSLLILSLKIILHFIELLYCFSSFYFIVSALIFIISFLFWVLFFVFFFLLREVQCSIVYLSDIFGYKHLFLELFFSLFWVLQALAWHVCFSSQEIFKFPF